MLGGLYNVTSAAAAKGSNNFVTLINDGDQTQVANSVNMKLVVRARNGLSLQGGFNTANTHSDYCAERAKVPEWTVVGGAEPDQSLVRHVNRMDHALHRARVVQPSKD